jgi:hypothetical protein
MSLRTLYEIVAHYEKAKDAPPEIIEAMLLAGMDPAAPRKRDVLSAAIGRWVAGATPEQAVAKAEELTKRHKAPPSTFPDSKLTKREQARFEFRVAVRKLLAEVPEDQKTEELRVTLGEEIAALLGDKAESFTVEPLQATIDPSGRRQEPEPAAPAPTRAGVEAGADFWQNTNAVTTSSGRSKAAGERRAHA